MHHFITEDVSEHDLTPNLLDTSPEQPIAAWTANELACLSGGKHVGVRRSRTPCREAADEAETSPTAGGQARTSPVIDSALSEMSPELPARKLLLIAHAIFNSGETFRAPNEKEG